MLLILVCFALLASCTSEQRDLPQNFVPQQVCYDGLGCFSTGGNFYDLLKRPIQHLPQSPDKIRPTFALYTRQNIVEGQLLHYGDASSVVNSYFDAKLPTKVIVHGFVENGNVAWMVEMKKALLLHGDYNVIQLDWSKGNQFPFTQAAANARVIGALIAQMIKWLETEVGANREDFHLLGHSLGSHVTGYAGERLRESRQLGRITGLDPAGPYFENTHPEVRLDPTDARFVDAIHTDGDSILSILKAQGGLGMMQAVGHVDFYVNGGKKQPDCKQNPITNIVIHGIIGGTLWTIACDHMRVVPLVTSTLINSQGDYKAFPCDSYENFKAGKCADCGTVGCAFMGARANEWNPKGLTNVKMFLDTDGKEPFEMHHYAVKITVSGKTDAKRQYGDLLFTLEGSNGHRTSELTVLSGSYMEPGEVITTLVTNAESVTDVTRLSVSWKHRWTLAILTQKLFLNRIEIFEGFTEKRSIFCVKNASIESGKSIMLSKSDSC